MEDQKFILICDDNEGIANSIVFFLKRAGYLARAVHSALDCVAVARRNRPDMILTDIMMPGMDGATVSGLLREVPGIEDVPIVLLSAMSDSQVRKCAEEAGASDYILKPFRKDLLLEVVQRCLSIPARQSLTA